MKNIEIAKKYLLENNLSLVIVKNGKVVVQENDRGIKPLFISILEKKEEIDGGVLADKVIGKAAAMLSSKANIKHIYTKMISGSAVEVLKNNNISLEYDLKVPNILNRTKTGSCPVEKMAKDEENVEALIEEIKKFLNLR